MTTVDLSVVVFVRLFCVCSVVSAKIREQKARNFVTD